MKTIIKIKFTTALAIACALTVPAAASADGCRDLSLRIARSALENSMRKIAVLDFTSKGGAEKSETAYVAEKMGIHLSGSKTVALIERSLLEKVLKEARLSSSAGGALDKAEILTNILSIDAVVTGTVFADGDKLRVLARLIEIKTGRVLLAAEGETGRLPMAASDDQFQSMEPPEVPFPELPAEWDTARALASRAAFRDAVADPSAESCSGRRRMVKRMNEELVDAKARYWAVKMKAPGFSRESLTRNPGSEIADPDVKGKFYKLLTAYYRAGGDTAIDTEKNYEVADLIKMENRVSDECGVH